MYHKTADSRHGIISSIVIKEFLSVIGDGKSTLLQLIEKGERTSFHLELLIESHQSELQTILPLGKKLQLQEIGNHCRGTTFKNGNHLIYF